jgi:hypothetical protein
MVFEVSGVSSASALSAGEDSAPDASEKRSGSKGLRGVVNDGLRNSGALLLFAVANIEGVDGIGCAALAGDWNPSVEMQC